MTILYWFRASLHNLSHKAKIARFLFKEQDTHKKLSKENYEASIQPSDIRDAASPSSSKTTTWQRRRTPYTEHNFSGTKVQCRNLARSAAATTDSWIWKKLIYGYERTWSSTYIGLSYIAMGGKRNCLVDCNLVPEKLRSVQMFGRRVGVVKVYADTANLFLLLDIVMIRK